METQEMYRRAARRACFGSGMIVEDHAEVMPVQGGGAYIQAWVWVDRDDAEMVARSQEEPLPDVPHFVPQESKHGNSCIDTNGEWSGSPDPARPDTHWICDSCGDSITDCVRCEWQLIETGEPGVCDTCGWNRLTGSGPEWAGKKGSE